MVHQLAKVTQTLAQRVLVIPSSITICERGISKQILVKSHLQASLTLKGPNALMLITLTDVPIDAI